MIYLRSGHVVMHPVLAGLILLLALVGTASLIVVAIDEVRIRRQVAATRARQAARAAGRDAALGHPDRRLSKTTTRDTPSAPSG